MGVLTVLFAERTFDEALDTRPYADEVNRCWIFVSVGHRHNVALWRDFVSTLRLPGYDGLLCIDHEDSL